MYVYTRSDSKQEDPKSMMRMVGFVGYLRRMFSGLRSQWMMCCEARNLSVVSACDAMRRMSMSDMPLKLLILRYSYKFTDRGSKVMHRWLRK